MNNDNGSIWFSLGLDNSQLEKQSQYARQQIKSISDQMVAEGSRMDSVFNNIARGIGVAFTLGSAWEFTKQVAQVRSEFQQLEITFETMLKSKSKADQLIQEMTAFAAHTPFELTDVGNGARMLLAVGESAENIIPTLKALGDVSAGLNVPLERLILNYGQVKTKGVLQGTDLKDFLVAGVPIIGELAKNLNRSEQEIKDLVSAGKIGFNEVAKAFRTMSGEGGRFADLMTAQSKTINGQISNLKDNFATMLNDIGKRSEGAFSSAISGANYLVENYQKVGQIIGELVATYGVYKAILISITAVQRLNSMVLRQAVIEKRLAAATNITLSNSEAVAVARTKLLSVAKMQLTRVMRTLNATMLANPYVLVAVAVAGLAYGIYKLTQTIDGAEKAQEDFNQKQKEAQELEQKRKQEVEDLISVVKNETSAEVERIKAMNQLKRLYPEIFKDYDTERLKLEEISKIKKQIAEQDATQKHQNAKEELRAYQEAYDYYKNFKEGKAKHISDRTAEINKKIKGLNDENIREYFETTLNNLQDGIFKEEFAKIRTQASDEKLAFLQQEVRKYTAMLKAFANENSRVKIGFGGVDLDLRKEDVQDIIKEYDAVIQKLQEPKFSYVELERKYNQELKKAQEELKEIQQNKEKFSEEQLTEKINQAQENIKQAEEKLKKLQGNKAQKSAKKPFNEAEHLEQSKRLETDRIFAIEQAKIDAMEEGFSKEMAQIELHHRQKIETIQRQKADAIRQLNSEEGVTTTAKNFRLEVINNNAHEQERIAGEQKALHEQKLRQKLVEQYQTHEEKLAEIHRKYAQDRTELELQFSGELLQEKLNLWQKAYDEDLAKVNQYAEQVRNGITELFSHATEQGQEQLEALNQKAQQVKEMLLGGAYDPEKGQALGISKEQFEALKNAPADLKIILDLIEQIRQKTLEGKGYFSAMKESFKEMINASNKADFNQKLNQFNGQLNKGVEGLKLLSDTFKSLGEATDSEGLQEFGEALQSVVDVAQGTMQGAMTGAALGGPIGAVIGGAFGLVSSISKKIAEAEKKHREAMRKIREGEINQQRTLNKLLYEEQMLQKNKESVFGVKEISRAIGYLEIYRQQHEKLQKSITRGEASYKRFGITAKRFKASDLDKLQIKTGHMKTGLFGWGAGRDIYSSITKVYPELIDKAGNFNRKVAESILNSREFQHGHKEALQEIINHYDRAEKAQEQFNQYLKQTFGELGTAIVDSVVNALKTGEDAFENFAKTAGNIIGKLGKQLIYEVFVADEFKKFQEELRKIGEEKIMKTETYTEEKILKNGDINHLTAKHYDIPQKPSKILVAKEREVLDEIATAENFAKKSAKKVMEFTKGMKGRMDLMKNTLELYMNEARKEFDFDIFGNQNPTAKERGFARMSQDSADQLNGQFRLMTELQKQQVNATLQMAQQSKSVADEMKFLQSSAGQQLRHLAQIETNTAELRQMRGDLSHLKLGMEQLTSKGIKVID